MKIRNKRQFYRLWHAGLLGNRPRTWKNARELAGSSYSGLVTIRSTTDLNWATRYRVPVTEALAESAEGATFNESMPDDNLVLQGEVARTWRGLELTWDDTPGLGMKDAMKRSAKMLGARALCLLRAELWPSSLDDLWALLDLYPDAVIEFSAYDRAVGVLPHRNTIIWEVRDY